MVTAKIGGDAYVFVTSALDDAITIFAVNDDGLLTMVDEVSSINGALNMASDVEIQVIEDRVFASVISGGTTGNFNVLSLVINDAIVIVV